MAHEQCQYLHYLVYYVMAKLLVGEVTVLYVRYKLVNWSTVQKYHLDQGNF